MLFQTHINGIPCQCRIVNYEPYCTHEIYGSGMGDWHPPEDGLFNFELLDRKGYKAPWLERYITPDVEDRLYGEFLAVIKEAIYDSY